MSVRSLLIVDALPVVRAGYARLIESQHDLTLVAEAENRAEALQQVRRSRPDLVVLDWAEAQLDGIELIKEIHSECETCRILVVSSQQQPFYILRAMQCGANGFLSKGSQPGALLEAIRELASGRDHFSKEILILRAAAMDRNGRHKSGLSLTDRELSVFRMVGEGRSCKEIAAALGVSGKTVETHRANIKAKLGISSFEALIATAARWEVCAHCSDFKKSQASPDGLCPAVCR